MKIFSFIASMLLAGACFANTPQQVRATGRAVLFPSSIQVLVVPGTIFEMTPRDVFEIDFKDGVFTVLQPSTYTITYSVRVCASAADKDSSITVGICVNNTAVKTLVLGPTPPPLWWKKKVFLFRGWDGCHLELKAGDKISLRVINTSLPPKAIAFFPAKPLEGSDHLVASFRIHSPKSSILLPP